MSTFAATGVATAAPLTLRCPASSSYDLTVQPDRLVFDRTGPAPTRVVMGRSSLVTDGTPVALNAEDQDRVALFDRDLRALLPRVRRVAGHGVDVAVQAIRDEASGLSLAPATRQLLDQHLATDADALHQRIDTSQSTRDWQGDAVRQLGDQFAADLGPIVAGDLGQQALQAAMNGDLDTASRLRDQAADLATTLQPRIASRLKVLQPQIDALCPSIERLAGLQQGLRDAQGRPLQLLDAAGR
ncbi:hypothetical protein ATSB10_24820 [Dyella thiooxydans]|uniref:DUF2884 family protein n=2 Tax=Dyella thiooxydans TaxID=445710 RepID=A0A160N238_9GAMM|nr:hypothetical protein ATSB10_24820 [Dyella thiooxydans]